MSSGSGGAIFASASDWATVRWIPSSERSFDDTDARRFPNQLATLSPVFSIEPAVDIWLAANRVLARQVSERDAPIRSALESLMTFSRIACIWSRVMTRELACGLTGA